MEILFDENGLITPKTIIEVSLIDLEQIFVNERKDKVHRKKIFDQYLLHNEKIQQQIGNILFQFVNGSFTTLKEKPNDIDVVTFIDYRTFRSKERTINDLSESWDGIAEIDAYIIPKSYPGHPLFIQSQLMYEYWKTLFSRTREDNSGKRLEKGLLKVNLNEK